MITIDSDVEIFNYTDDNNAIMCVGDGYIMVIWRWSPITKNTTGIRGIYITITSTTMVFANEKNRFTTITVSRLLLQLL